MTSEAGSPRCLNCGAELSGNYCSSCGQEDIELRVSLKRLAKDFLAEQIGLESKVPTTLWKLISRPGLLTREYLGGRRVRSLLPLRLYLSASVVYFLLLSLPMFSSGFDSNMNLTGFDQAALDSAESASRVRGRVIDSTATMTILGKPVSAREDGTGLERFVQRRLKRFQGMTAEEVGQVFRSSFIKYMPNAIFFLLPVFTLICYLAYRKTGRYFAEHLIFALHIHAFAFVVLIISLVMPDALEIVVPIWLLVYLFMAMRKVYEESRKRTALKFTALLFSYMIILQITMLGVLGLIFAIG